MKMYGIRIQLFCKKCLIQLKALPTRCKRPICQPGGAATASVVEGLKGQVSSLRVALCYEESTVTVKFIDPELDTDEWLGALVSELFIWIVEEGYMVAWELTATGG